MANCSPVVFVDRDNDCWRVTLAGQSPRPVSPDIAQAIIAEAMIRGVITQHYPARAGRELWQFSLTNDLGHLLPAPETRPSLPPAHVYTPASAPVPGSPAAEEIERYRREAARMRHFRPGVSRANSFRALRRERGW